MGWIHDGNGMKVSLNTWCDQQIYSSITRLTDAIGKIDCNSCYVRNKMKISCHGDPLEQQCLLAVMKEKRFLRLSISPESGHQYKNKSYFVTLVILNRVDYLLPLTPVTNPSWRRKLDRWSNSIELESRLVHLQFLLHALPNESDRINMCFSRFLHMTDTNPNSNTHQLDIIGKLLFPILRTRVWAKHSATLQNGEQLNSGVTTDSWPSNK